MSKAGLPVPSSSEFREVIRLLADPTVTEDAVKTQVLAGFYEPLQQPPHKWQDYFTDAAVYAAYPTKDQNPDLLEPFLQNVVVTKNPDGTTPILYLSHASILLAFRYLAIKAGVAHDVAANFVGFVSAQDFNLLPKYFTKYYIVLHNMNHYVLQWHTNGVLCKSPVHFWCQAGVAERLGTWEHCPLNPHVMLHLILSVLCGKYQLRVVQMAMLLPEEYALRILWVYIQSDCQNGKTMEFVGVCYLLYLLTGKIPG